MPYSPSKKKKNGSVFIFNTLFTNTATETCKSVVDLLVIKTSTNVVNHVKLLRKFKRCEKYKTYVCMYVCEGIYLNSKPEIKQPPSLNFLVSPFSHL